MRGETYPAGDFGSRTPQKSSDDIQVKPINAKRSAEASDALVGAEVQMEDVGGAPAPRRGDSEESLAEQIQRAAHESFSGDIADVNNLTTMMTVSPEPQDDFLSSPSHIESRRKRVSFVDTSLPSIQYSVTSGMSSPYLTTQIGFDTRVSHCDSTRVLLGDTMKRATTLYIENAGIITKKIFLGILLEPHNLEEEIIYDLSLLARIADSYLTAFGKVRKSLLWFIFLVVNPAWTIVWILIHARYRNKKDRSWEIGMVTLQFFAGNLTVWFFIDIPDKYENIRKWLPCDRKNERCYFDFFLPARKHFKDIMHPEVQADSPFKMLVAQDTFNKEQSTFPFHITKFVIVVVICVQFLFLPAVFFVRFNNWGDSCEQDYSGNCDDSQFENWIFVGNVCFTVGMFLSFYPIGCVLLILLDCLGQYRYFLSVYLNNLKFFDVLYFSETVDKKTDDRERMEQVYDSLHNYSILLSKLWQRILLFGIVLSIFGLTSNLYSIFAEDLGQDLEQKIDHLCVVIFMFCLTSVVLLWIAYVNSMKSRILRYFISSQKARAQHATESSYKRTPTNTLYSSSLGLQDTLSQNSAVSEDEMEEMAPLISTKPQIKKQNSLVLIEIGTQYFVCSVCYYF